MPYSKGERRAFPRVGYNFPVTVMGKDFRFSADTKNISCSGLYCKADISLFLNWKVTVRLLLNGYRSPEEIGWASVVQCKGVVVRHEVEKKAPYDLGIGIKFTQLSAREKNRILKYMDLIQKKNGSLKKLRRKFF